MIYPSTPTLDKIKNVGEESNSIGAFVDWLNGVKHIQLYQYIPDGEVDCSLCNGEGGTTNKHIGYKKCPDCHQGKRIITAHYEPAHSSIDRLLHEYFGINEGEEEKERRAVLEWIRNQPRGVS